MANYRAMWRSNYFAVKDVPAFEAFCKRWDLRMIDDERTGQKLYGFLMSEYSEGGVPTVYYNRETGDIDENTHPCYELKEHLLPSWVAVVQDGGMIKGVVEEGEKWRYTFRDGKCFRQDEIETWGEEYEV